MTPEIYSPWKIFTPQKIFPPEKYSLLKNILARKLFIPEKYSSLKTSRLEKYSPMIDELIFYPTMGKSISWICLAVFFGILDISSSASVLFLVIEHRTNSPNWQFWLWWFNAHPFCRTHLWVICPRDNVWKSSFLFSNDEI